MHESTDLFLINNKDRNRYVFFIVFNEFRNVYYIASQTDIEGLDQKMSKEVKSWSYYYLVGKKTKALVNKLIKTKKDGSPRKYPKTVKVEGEKVVPIQFKESIDAAIYIDEKLKEFTDQAGGLSPLRSGKFQF